MTEETPITREEHVACELINYIEAKPEHDNGLCYYLVHKNGSSEDDRPNHIEPNAYQMIDVARSSSVLTKFGRDCWVDGKSYGPTARRVEFTEALLGLLISGRLYCKNDYWQLRNA